MLTKPGYKFSKLEILKEIDYLKGKPANKRIFECRCECGIILTVSYSRFIGGSSCGCDMQIFQPENKLSIKYPFPCPWDSSRSFVSAILKNYKADAKRRKIEWKLEDEFAFTIILSPCSYCGEKCEFPKSKNGIELTIN